jgi:hypothetical protein
MADTAELVKLELAAGAVAPRPGLPSAGTLAFRPETFFLGRTEGAGVVRDPFGRIVRRCRVVTDGSLNPTQGGIRFDEVLSYDDGEVDTWRWVMTPGRGGRYVAAEARAGAGITGELRDDDYLIGFRRPVRRARGALSPRFRTRFTMLTADIAMKQAKVSLLGLPLGMLTAVHRRGPF